MNFRSSKSMHFLLLMIACGCAPATQQTEPAIGNHSRDKDVSRSTSSHTPLDDEIIARMRFYESDSIYRFILSYHSWEPAVAELNDEQLSRLELFLQEKSLPSWFVFSADPRALQFSCAVSIDSEEASWHDLIKAGDSRTKLAAAGVLWRMHSRRHAKDVIALVENLETDQEAVRLLQNAVDASLRPESIHHELEHGDYRWGCWLAFLRPNADLVPVLLRGLDTKPEFEPEIVLTLGNSKDDRAYEQLLERMMSDDYRKAGDAANALGLLGNPNAEPHLIQALSSENRWLQVNACRALSFIGTRNSIPGLARLANDDQYTGALAIRRVARFAIDRIAEREEP